MSVSRSPWRTLMDEGNRAYARAKAPGTPPSLHASCATVALQCYERSLSNAKSDDERASTYKNQAAASILIVRCPGERVETRMFYLEQFLQVVGQAWTMGVSKDRTWKESLLRLFFEGLNTAILELGCQNHTPSMPAMLRGFVFDVNKRPPHAVKAIIGLQLFAWQHRRASRMAAEKDWAGMLNVLSTYRALFEDLRGSLKVDELPDEICQFAIDELNSYEVSMAEAEIQMLLGKGLRYMDSCLNETDDSGEMTHFALLALDQFRFAIALSQNSMNALPELEAQAASYSGRVYNMIFRMEDAARVRYHAAIALAHSCSPRTFTSDIWYIEALRFLEEYQERLQQEEARAREAEREPILKMLEAELAKLKEASEQGLEALLAYVYLNYIPDEQDNTAETPKKRLLNAILRVHPDKQVKKDLKTQVLFQEVTKYLNAQFEMWK